MKVLFNYAVRTYSGTIDNMVYGSYQKNMFCIGRKYIYPTLTDNNKDFGKVAENLADCYNDTSGAYQDDVKDYAGRLKTKIGQKAKKLALTSYAIFIRMMYAWQASDPDHVDLATITVGDIVLADAPVLTVATAIEADLMPKVPDYFELDNPMGE